MTPIAATWRCRSGFAVSASELVVVSLPPGKRALLETCAALLGRRSIFTTPTAVIHLMGSAAIALATDNMENAIHSVRPRFLVFGEADSRGRNE
jgi:hypothetical protein